MADKNLLSQMLESLVNDEQAKAEELFHEYVVAKSREIYETLIESEMDDEEEEVEEAADDEEAEEEKVEEAFGDEGEDEFGGDATDDLEGEMDADAEDEFGGEEESEEELMQDLGDIIDELQAKFDALSGAEEEQGEFGDEGEDEFGASDEFGSEEEPEEGFDLTTVREYVEKVPAGHGAEKKGAGEKGAENNGLKFNKNDMGGTAGNILSGKNGQDGGEWGKGSTVKGSGLLKGTPQLQDGGNVNVPGGNVGKTGFKKKEPGHGAEKKGAAEGSTEAQSLFRGRR